MIMDSFIAPTKDQIRLATKDQLDALSQMIQDEIYRRFQVEYLSRQITSVSDEYKELVKDEPAKDLNSLSEGATIGPGEKIIVDNYIYTNKTKHFLSPFTEGPVNQPHYWSESKQ